MEEKKEPEPVITKIFSECYLQVLIVVFTACLLAYMFIILPGIIR